MVQFPYISLIILIPSSFHRVFPLYCLQFKEISFAYEVLSNPEKKETYDRYGLQGLKEGGGGGGGGKKNIPICHVIVELHSPLTQNYLLFVV